MNFIGGGIFGARMGQDKRPIILIPPARCGRKRWLIIGRIRKERTMTAGYLTRWRTAWRTAWRKLSFLFLRKELIRRFGNLTLPPKSMFVFRVISPLGTLMAKGSAPIR